MNNQNKKQVIIAAVLGVVLVSIFVYQFLIKGIKPTPPPGAGPSAAKVAKASAPAKGGRFVPGKSGAAKDASAIPVLETVDINLDELIASVTVEPVDYTTVAIARDPMEPLVGKVTPQTAEASAGGITAVGGVSAVIKPAAMMDAYSKQVTGIIWDAQHPMAVVDDEVVNVGHVFANGIKVHAIEPTRVVLQVGESLVPVEMKEL